MILGFVSSQIDKPKSLPGKDPATTKTVMLQNYMPREMSEYGKEIAIEALNEFNHFTERDRENIAKYIQKSFNRKFRGGDWNVVVGDKFGDWVKF